MTAASSTPPRVLVVDDELAIVEAFCETLEAQGYVTGGFTSAPDALAALDGNAFDLC
jgi:CheY-like chemotaxis protein